MVLTLVGFCSGIIYSLRFWLNWHVSQVLSHTIHAGGSTLCIFWVRIKYNNFTCTYTGVLCLAYLILVGLLKDYMGNVVFWIALISCYVFKCQKVQGQVRKCASNSNLNVRPWLFFYLNLSLKWNYWRHSRMWILTVSIKI